MYYPNYNYGNYNNHYHPHHRRNTNNEIWKGTICLIILIFGFIGLVYFFNKFLLHETNNNNTGKGNTTSSNNMNNNNNNITNITGQIETLGFDETEVNADIVVINFRVQSFAPDDETKARMEFLKILQEIESQCNYREIPFQLIPKNPEPFVFVQNVAIPNLQMMQQQNHNMMPPIGGDLPAHLQPPITTKSSKLYSITQDFSLPLLLSRSPPIPLFLDTLASHGVLISGIEFPLSAQRKTDAEKSSLLKAIADAKSKAVFLANEQKKSLGNIMQITPVKVKINQIKDVNMDILMGQLSELQNKYQQQLKLNHENQVAAMDPYSIMNVASNPMMFPHQFPGAASVQGLHFNNPNVMNNSSHSFTGTTTTTLMDPLKVLSSSLVPKKLSITTQVRVRFEVQ